MARKNSDLKLLGIYRNWPQNMGRHESDSEIVLRLSTPGGILRDVELRQSDLVRIIRQASDLLEIPADGEVPHVQ